jgi:hypothetical protein
MHPDASIVEPFIEYDCHPQMILGGHSASGRAALSFLGSTTRISSHWNFGTRSRVDLSQQQTPTTIWIL